MDWIQDGLAVGNRREAMDARLLEHHRIESVLLLYESEAPAETFAVTGEVLQLIVHDGRPVAPDILRWGAAFIRAQRALGRGVLVACAMGISRSPSFVVGHLVEEGLSLDEALRLVMAGRRVALPHPALLRSIAECYGLCLREDELLSALLRARRAIREGADSGDTSE